MGVVMPKLRFPDGDVWEIKKGTLASEVVRRLSERLLKEALCVRVDGVLQDLNAPIETDSDSPLEFYVITERDAEALSVLRHSSSHIMADAVARIFGRDKVKLAIGPSIEEGFYYDFDLPHSLSTDDLPKIEKEMEKIIAENLPFTMERMKKSDAYALFKSLEQTYKLELLDEIEDEMVTVYRHGEFVDLCRGPHIPSTGRLKYFKLLSVAGAYWRGDEKRQMLVRIYGTAFFKKEELDSYLKKLEEAKARDHRVLGKQLDYFSFNPDIGPGLVLWHPKGGMLRHIIENFWKEEHFKRGYQLVYTPHIASEQIYKTSGHLEKYSEFLYAPMEIEGVAYRLKPMNCPGHIAIYKSKKRSYRELPIRYAELGTVYRFERSGVLAGLLRVRGFTQDDAHIFCTQEQLGDEVLSVIRLSDFMMKSFGFKYKIFLATRPEKYIGTDEVWERATNALKEALERFGAQYEIDPGGGVYYGPKIDIKMEDALERLWQGPTIQVDFNLPERFDVNYVSPDGKEKRVVMVHRTVLGSMERFLGVLLEHYGGLLPLWLAPVQAIVLPVKSEQNDYAREIAQQLSDHHLRVLVNERNDTLPAKVRDAELEKIPYILIVGEREKAENLVSVRRKTKGQLGRLSVEELLKIMLEEEREKK